MVFSFENMITVKAMCKYEKRKSYIKRMNTMNYMLIDFKLRYNLKIDI